ncbi:MAG: hypothetical protein CVV25_03725 [Ignavibacteriae bacterium HGW-Ignavibacteriae-4]|nr:MAG: hypothetical protein CVV25_03725 [Ignavibacteriae bacterium HGW-Ignavibacteriae-4]
MKKIIQLLIGITFASTLSFTAKAEFNKDGVLEVPGDFNLFTSKNLQGYTKPLFTTIGQGAQSNLFTVASYDESYSIGMDFSLSSTLIPGSQQVYDAVLPAAFGDTNRMDNAAYLNGKIVRNVGGTIEQPTIYGGASNAIYVVAPVKGGDPADSIYKTIAFNEGTNITTMASLPAFQLVFGLPTRTELRFRYLGAPVDDQMYSHLAISANQQLDHWMDLFDESDNMALALNVSYQFMTLAKTIDMNSWAVGLHFSKGFGDGLSVYGGLQVEDLSGTFNMVRQNGYNADYYEVDGKTLKSASAIPKEQQLNYQAHVAARKDVETNPFEEVRYLKPLTFDIESFTSWRFTVGGAYEYGIMELHLDMGYASQMFLNGGIRLRFKEWGNSSASAE